jgi:hypothetical protein
MNELYRIFGIKWKRPLKWYDKLLIIWVNVAFCGLAVDMDSIPFSAVVLIVANLCASLWACIKVLPDIKDNEE